MAGGEINQRISLWDLVTANLAPSYPAYGSEERLFLQEDGTLVTLCVLQKPLVREPVEGLARKIRTNPEY